MLGFALGLRRLGRRRGCRRRSRASSRCPSRSPRCPASICWCPRPRRTRTRTWCLSSTWPPSPGSAPWSTGSPGPGSRRARPPRVEHRFRRSTWSTRRRPPPRWWPSSCSRRLDVPLDPAIAECLYVALATDTGSFRFDMTTPRVHEMAARLIATGIRPGEISRRIFDTRPFGAMKLFAEVLARAALDPSAAGGNGWCGPTRRWTTWPARPAAVRDGRAHRPGPLVAEADVAVLVKQVAERRVGGVAAQQGRGRREPGRGGPGRRRTPAGGGFTGHGTPGDVVVGRPGPARGF